MQGADTLIENLPCVDRFGILQPANAQVAKYQIARCRKTVGAAIAIRKPCTPIQASRIIGR
jgi:hypothetical protein